MLTVDMQFMLVENLPFLTWRPSGLTPLQIWWSLSVYETGSWMPCSLSWSCVLHTSYIVLWMKSNLTVRELYITGSSVVNARTVNTFKNRLDRECGNKSSQWTLCPTSTHPQVQVSTSNSDYVIIPMWLVCLLANQRETLREKYNFLVFSFAR